MSNENYLSCLHWHCHKNVISSGLISWTSSSSSAKGASSWTLTPSRVFTATFPSSSITSTCRPSSFLFMPLCLPSNTPPHWGDDDDDDDDDGGGVNDSGDDNVVVDGNATHNLTYLNLRSTWCLLRIHELFTDLWITMRLLRNPWSNLSSSSTLLT